MKGGSITGRVRRAEDCAEEVTTETTANAANRRVTRRAKAERTFFMEEFFWPVVR